MKIIDKIFRDKKGNSVIYILLAIGIFLIALGGNLGKKESKPAVIETSPKQSEEKNIAAELEETLSQIKGAGEVHVMLVYDNDGKKNFGYDSDSSQKKTVILNKQGGEEALIREEITPEVRGVIIVADGGGNVRIKEALTHAAQTVLGIAPHKIEVFERKDSQ